MMTSNWLWFGILFSFSCRTNPRVEEGLGASKRGNFLFWRDALRAVRFNQGGQQRCRPSVTESPLGAHQEERLEPDYYKEVRGLLPSVGNLPYLCRSFDLGRHRSCTRPGPYSRSALCTRVLEGVVFRGQPWSGARRQDCGRCSRRRLARRRTRSKARQQPRRQSLPWMGSYDFLSGG